MVRPSGRDAPRSHPRGPPGCRHLARCHRRPDHRRRRGESRCWRRGAGPGFGGRGRRRSARAMSNPSAAPALDHTQAQVRDARNSWLAPLRQQLVFSQARAMTIVAILLIVLFSRTAPSFFSASNFIVIGATSSYVAIVAVGLTVLFIVGEFDLSLGAIYGVSGTLIALMSIKWGLSPVVALLFGLLLSAGVGLINGAFTTLGRVPSFIVTIGMLSVL